jgi:hypothetical protein
MSYTRLGLCQNRLDFGKPSRMCNSTVEISSHPNQAVGYVGLGPISGMLVRVCGFGYVGLGSGSGVWAWVRIREENLG